MESLPSDFVFLLGISQVDGTLSPSGDGFIAFPAAGASPFQINATGKGRATIAVRQYRLSAVRAFVLEEVGMLQCAADERAEPYRVGRYLSRPSGTAVSHLHEEGNEVEFVVVLPFIKAGIDFRGMLVEQFGVEQLLGSRAFSALLEEIVLVHDTDFF